MATGVEGENRVVGQSGVRKVTVNTKGESGIAEHVDGARTLETGQGGKPHDVMKGVPEQTKLPDDVLRLADAAIFCASIAKTAETNEAKAVYQCLGKILEAAKAGIGNDFSAKNIGNALKAALEGKSNLSDFGGTGTVGMYDGGKDDPSVHGKPSAWGNVQLSYNVCKNLKISTDTKAIKHCANKCSREFLNDNSSSVEISVESVDKKYAEKTPSEYLIKHFSKPLDKPVEISVDKKFKITCDAGTTPSKYIKQFEEQANTFSGNIHVHKLEPGTVLVRVFGKEQSPLRPCWSKLDDPNSSVTCANDLLNKLAVLPEWNGDGNMAIMIVPNDFDVFVAEGKIGHQIASYSRSQKQTSPSEEVVTETFVFPGGGNQFNILTEDLDKDEVEGKKVFPPFANDKEGKLNDCMVCFRDTNMACIQDNA